ncbi:MAG: helix-turn-helix domain-containing protein [Oscillospiraceae bacterium]|nr:helix-turn-helix domain-containing protein [Oscillospiraceae bacterium]
MNIDYKEVGRRMSKRRKELGLKQYQVCEMIDVNYKYISNLETGRSVPSLDVIMRLCEALQTTPDYLLLGSDKSESIVSDKTLTEKISVLDPKSKAIVSGVIDLLNDYR